MAEHDPILSSPTIVGLISSAIAGAIGWVFSRLTMINKLDKDLAIQRKELSSIKEILREEAERQKTMDDRQRVVVEGVVELKTRVSNLEESMREHKGCVNFKPSG